MLGHFFGLDPAGAAVHECYVAAVAVAGLCHPPLYIGVNWLRPRLERLCVHVL